MTRTIELPDEDVTALAAKAQAHGVSAEGSGKRLQVTGYRPASDDTLQG